MCLETFTMPNFNHVIPFLVAIVLLTAFATPAFAATYSPGVTVGQYVKYGNFVGTGPGFESFNDYHWLKLQVTNVSGSEVTLLSTGQFRNGTAIPGNGTTNVWDVATGTENGVPNTEGPIVAANLNQGDPIPPPNTYNINQTNTAVFLGVSRSVNVLDVDIFTPDYNTTLSYVYDRASGMLLESISQTTTQAQPQPVKSTYAYTIIETNIFASTMPTPSPTVPELSYYTVAILAVLATTVILVSLKRKTKTS
jgi:hypothetical protein